MTIMKRKHLPLEARRAYLYDVDMPEALQGPTSEFHERLRIANKRDLLAKHTMGTWLHHIVEKPGTYGPEALQQVADFTGIPGGIGALLYMKQFSEEFPRHFIIEQANKPMANGGFLTYAHFLQLAAVHSLKKQRELLARVRAEGLSVAQLRREVARIWANG